MLLKGSIYTDERGSISFVNNFNLTPIVRMYRIEPKPGVVRAWQGHQKETKWFHVAKGKIEVKVRELESKDLVGTYTLRAEKPTVLKIAPGHYNGFKGVEEGSILMVFSNLTLEGSQKDDHRLSLEELPW